MAAIDIQLAIQGGGAKICTLLPAMEAVEELQAAGRIRVTRVAGTSAGALAGALLVSELPIATIRTALRQWPDSKVSQMFPPVSIPTVAWRLMRRRPVWNLAALETEMARALPVEVRTLADLRQRSGVDLFIVVSDLRGRRTLVLAQDNVPITNALADSCALPFLFRAWQRANEVLNVDGGICSNLPVHVLLRGEAEYGPVFAVSLAGRENSASPKSAPEFCVALLDTAIEAGMETARELLPARQVLRLVSEFGTFEFLRAKREGLEEPVWRMQKENTTTFFERAIEEITTERAKIAKQRETEQARQERLAKSFSEVTTGLMDVYRRNHKPCTFKYHRLRFVVIARSLADRASVDYASDEITYTMEFSPTKDAIHCHHAFLELDQSAQFRNQKGKPVTVRDASGRDVDVTSIFVGDPHAGGMREGLLFFSPPLPVSEPPERYTLQLRYSAWDSGMVLREQGSDDFEADLREARVDGFVDRVEFVFAAPVPDRSKLSMSAPSGRQMSDNELQELTTNVSPAFDRVGWIAEKVEGGKQFVVRLRLIPV